VDSTPTQYYVAGKGKEKEKKKKEFATSTHRLPTPRRAASGVFVPEESTGK